MRGGCMETDLQAEAGSVQGSPWAVSSMQSFSNGSSLPLLPACAPLPQRPPAQQVADGRRVRALAVHAFLTVYPWVHAVHEGARFAYQLLYLLDATPYYSPSLHLLRLAVVRVTGQELVRSARSYVWLHWPSA